ncbi:MAG TPA: hypothetical protein VFK88_08955 [Gallionella sp.]|nr:hypothetical protein [Gallionella sp.]
MKQQITRFSPHQNAKVTAILMAIGSLIFVVPIFVLVALKAPAGTQPPMAMLIIMPLIYLIFGYISIAILSAVYNFLYKYIGGIEFESTTEANETHG